MTVNEYWNEFLEKKNLPKTTIFSGELSFENDEDSSAYLLNLVLSGQKRATCSSLESFQIDMEAVPKEGNLYVLTDFKGNPKGIVKTDRVTILPFKDMSWDLAKKEGEDETFESWKQNHIDFFEEDSAIMGYEFNDDMIVVFEEFSLLYTNL